MKDIKNSPQILPRQWKGKHRVLNPASSLFPKIHLQGNTGIKLAEDKDSIHTVQFYQMSNGNKRTMLPAGLAKRHKEGSLTSKPLRQYAQIMNDDKHIDRKR